jgi:Ca-activated chloride channel family protein
MLSTFALDPLDPAHCPQPLSPGFPSEVLVMSLLRVCCFWLAVLLASPLAALTPPPPPPPPRPATVWVAPGLQPIRLAEVDITIRATGMVAETVLDLRFENPNTRVLEGELVFPLLPGQTVSGYALEVEGALREGVVVPKETARVAFESITRQGIDPGLAELVAGNVFRTRLYPIPAQGTKRVQLRVVSALEDAGTHWRYQLPLQFAAPVGRFRVRAEAAAPTLPVVEAVQEGDPALAFDAAGTRWVAELSRTDVQPRRPLAFLIPKSEGAASVLVAVDERAPEWRSVVAQVETGGPPEWTQVSVSYSRIAIYYDASRRALDRERALEQVVLAELIQSLGRVEVTLIPFRDVAEVPRLMSLTDGDAAPLIKAIDALPLDGGASYGAIDLKDAGSAELVLLVGDGLSSFGPGEPMLTGADGRRPPVQVLMAASSGDPARLTRIARASGGGLIDISRTGPNTVSELLAPAWRLHSVRTASGECTDVTPTAPAAVSGILTIHARCRGKGPLKLSFGDGMGRDVVRRVDYAATEPVETALAPAVHQLWAQARIAELEAEATPDEARITELGVRYGVVTRTTSLLVLDRIEDYVRYRVEPKEADLRERYRQLLAQQPKAAPDPGEPARLDALHARWQAFRAKHEADYPGIEALLVTLAEAERAAWAGDPGEREAEGLLKQAQALTARWTREGGEAKSRAVWEREAARLVYALEALRARRPARVASAPAQVRDMVAGEAIEVGEALAPPPAPAPMAEAASAPRPAAAAPDLPVIAARTSPSPGAGRREQLAIESEPAEPAEPAPPRARVELAGWQPDAPYLATLREAKDAYAEYLRLREQYGTQPSYYLDAADLLREAKQPALAQRVLSNLAALDPGNTALLRVMAYRLMQWGTPAPAAHAFEVALSQRPEEPQSHRDFALALAKLPIPDRARAARLLWTVATNSWDGRFPDIELIALHELNDLLASAGAAAPKPAALGIDPRFVQPLPVGLRVVLTWDANDTDIDLWVVDPAGERTYYSAPQSPSGGQMSSDFTDGYGPEVYTIRRPMPGTYRVLVNYFGDRRQSLTGPVTLQLAFQTGFNSPESRETAVTVRLGENRETQEIGSFRVAEPE